MSFCLNKKLLCVDCWQYVEITRVVLLQKFKVVKIISSVLVDAFVIQIGNCLPFPGS